MFKWFYTSPIGEILITSDGKAVTGMWFVGQRYFCSNDDKYEQKELAVFKNTAEYLDRHFKGDSPDMNIPLAPEGTAFRQSVWHILRDIPYGKTITYGDIAKRIEEDTGRGMSAQAVGGAVGHNPISNKESNPTA